MRIAKLIGPALCASLLSIGLAVVVLGPGSPLVSASSSSNASPAIYWGAFIDGSQYGFGGVPADMRGVYAFESHAQKKLSTISFGQSFQWQHAYQPFQPKWMDNIRNHGSIPFITWGSQNLGDGANQPNFQNRKIYGGTYDSFITQWATDAKNWGHPFFLRLDWEMDGWWYPWGEGQTSPGGPIVNGNSAGDYVKMWRHVHDIFTQVGATNVTWVWCTNHEGTTTQYPPLSQIYPGDSYVDWTCIDPYNRYSTWITFNQTLTGQGLNWLKNTYQLILNVAPTKPIILGEFASREDSVLQKRKANWIIDALLTQVPYDFPMIKGIQWYNMAGSGLDATLPIESSSYSQAAFAKGIASWLYPANIFGNISQSPIPPLR